MWSYGVKTLMVIMLVLSQISKILAQNLTTIAQQSAELPTTQKPIHNDNAGPYSFRNSTHGLRSDPILILDDRTIVIPNFYYDGLKPDAFFWIGNGPLPTSNGIFALEVPLSASVGKNVSISLPHNLTANVIDYLSVWCPNRNESFGFVSIPRNYRSTLLETGVNDNKTVIALHKCCAINQVLTSTGCAQENNQNFSPLVNVHQHNETHINDEPLPAAVIKFTPIVQPIECETKRYPLIPQIDLFSLLENRTLIIASSMKLVPPEKYCFESVNLGSETEAIWETVPIVCFTGADNSKSSTVFYIYAVGISVSAFLLILTAAVFLRFKEIRDTRGKCVIFYSIAMAAAFIFLATAQFSGIENTTCTVFGFIIQFFLVQSFTWLSMLSWETFYKIKNHDNDCYHHDKKRFCIYIIIGIALPIVTSIITYVVDRVPGIPNTFLKPKFGRNDCWFDQNGKTMVYFYLPIGLAIIFNVVINILMKCYLIYFERNHNTNISWIATRSDLKPMFRSCVFVLIVMTLCWLMEVITFAVKDLGSFGIAMDIINSLQGVFIFAIFVLHRPVKGQLKKLKERNFFNREKNCDDKKESMVYRNGTDSVDHQPFLTDLRHNDSIEEFR